MPCSIARRSGWLRARTLQTPSWRDPLTYGRSTRLALALRQHCGERVQFDQGDYDGSWMFDGTKFAVKSTPYFVSRGIDQDASKVVTFSDRRLDTEHVRLLSDMEMQSTEIACWEIPGPIHMI